MLHAPACRGCAEWRKKTRFASYAGWVTLSLFLVAYAFSGEATGFWEQRGIVMLAEIVAFAAVQIWFFHYAEENLYNLAFNRLWIERFSSTGASERDVTLAIRDIALRDDIERMSKGASPQDEGTALPPIMRDV